MAAADLDRDERIAQLLDEMHRPGSTIRDAETLWHIHPDVAEEVLRLAKTEAVLHDAVRDWRQPAGDETVSRFAVSAGSDTEGEAGTSKSSAPLDRVGRYRIVQLLGEGGMGAVYAADDPQLQRRVAVKVPHFTGSPERQENSRRRFLREARSAAAVQHANVCPIHDVGEHEGRPFVVMALVEGESLTQRLRRRPRLEVRDAVLLAAKIAAGLGAVHAHGIVHRDLKPGNILLRPVKGTGPVPNSGQNVEPVLTDFGLAQITHDEENLTADGMILGTPAYMAPEQADPTLGPVTAQSDLYSLGVILFEMVTERRPYQGSMMQIISQVSAGNAPSALQFRPDLDPALDALISRAMARRPADRFADAAAFAEALHHWLNDSPAATVTLQQPRASATATMHAPRRRLLLAGVVAAAVVIGSAMTIYFLRDDRPRQPVDPLPQPPIAGHDGKGQQTPVIAPAALRGDIDVKVWRKDDLDVTAKRFKKSAMTLRDFDALPTAPGDWLRIEVELNRPAYCYVVWIDTEGKLTPLYPWVNDDWKERSKLEAPTARLILPDVADAEAAAPLGPGPAGMETLLLLVRDEPLPLDVDLPKLIGQLPAQKAPDPRAAAWFENGVVLTKEVDRGPIRLEQAVAIENPVVQTQSILRAKLAELFPYTRAVSFSNKGD